MPENAETAPARVGGTFDQAKRRCPDGDDPAARRRAPLMSLAVSCGNTAPFGMHVMIGRIIAAHGEKRAGAHMQRHAGMLHSCSSQLSEKSRREMKPRRRRRHRTFGPGEHRLVVETVFIVRQSFAADVGRQRHPADGIDRLIERRPGQIEGEDDFAAVGLVLDHRFQRSRKADPPPITEAQAITWLEFPRRSGECLPARLIEPPVEKRLNSGRRSGATLTLTLQRRCKDLGVVEHEDVARLEK